MENEYKIGKKVECEKIITDDMIKKFACVSGDDNPVHLDEEYARKSRFKRRIAHGMLVASEISEVIGTKFPGYGTIYVAQNLMFEAPVFINEKIRIVVEIIEINKERHRLIMQTTVYKENGNVAISGTAEVIPPR